MEIECPRCGKMVKVEGEDLPDSGSERFYVICQFCEHEFLVGWCAELELR